jgi:hypothetical protein
MLPKIIGISGKKFNGKDTIGDYLVKKYGYTRIGFADALKEACRCIFGFDEEQLYGNKKETIDDFWKVTPRAILQYVGTDMFRDNIEKIIPHVKKDIWLRVIEKKINNILEINPDSKFVITDLRFENESQFINKLGGIKIRVTRQINNDKNNLYSFHDSEKEIDKLSVNYDMSNDGTLNELYENIDNLMDNLKHTTISRFDEIKYNFNEKTLIVLDIDDTIITMPNLNKDWWYNKYCEFSKIYLNTKEINKHVLIEWEKLLEFQFTEYKHKESVVKLLENNKNNVICLTSRDEKLKNFTQQQLLNMSINIPIYHSNTKKGLDLLKILNEHPEYREYKNIIFVDDLIENIIDVNDKLKNYNITCYLYK